jgi:hypothetical protein
VVHLSSLSVEYGLPPVLAKDIPTQIIDEDSGTHTKLIDLNQYFTDDFDNGKLNYEIPFQEDTTKVKAWIEGTHYLSVETMKKDWFGQVRFVVRAIDSSGLKTQSNTFTVQVNNVNDPPILSPVPDFTLTVGQLFEYQLVWSDPDPDTWTFTASPPGVLNLDPNTGKISTTPTKAQIGNYSMTYTITDKSGAQSSVHGQVIIMNKNSAPSLNQIGPQFLTVNSAYTYTATATDPDLEFKTEVLTFMLKFEDTNIPTGMKINGQTGVITWTPTKPGSYWATVIVTDKSGAISSEFVTFTVAKVNTAPHDLKITGPTDGVTVNSTAVVVFSAVATDDDIGDRISYVWYDNDTQFGVGEGFRTVLTTPGDHNIKVVASDGKAGHDVSATIAVKVVGAKQTQITTTKTQTSDAIPTSLVFLIVLLGAVIAVAVVATIYGRGGATRQKLKALEDEMKGTGPQAPPQQPQSPPK